MRRLQDERRVGELGLSGGAMMVSPDGFRVYGRMPKTGGTSVSAALEVAGWTHDARLRTHATAQEIRALYPDAELTGSIRGPLPWYRSWYAHGARALLQPNERVQRVMVAYGRGDTSWRSVLWGLTHLREIELPPQDHLWRPAGVGAMDWACEGGLWSQSVRWYYCDAEGDSLVRRWVHTSTLALDCEKVFGVAFEDVPHIRKGDVEGLVVDDEMMDWIGDADRGSQ